MDTGRATGSCRSTLRWVASAACLAAFHACGSDGEPAGVGTASVEPVVVRYVERPEGVLGWGSPRFTPDGSGISFTFAHRNKPERRDIGVLSMNTGAFQCLTCDVPRSLGSHLWFPDGRRLLIYYFGIFTDNFFVFDLDRPTQLQRIEGVKTSELTHDRFPVLSPDGKHLVWTKVRLDGFHLVMGDLVQEGDSYRVTNIRHLYPPPVTTEGNLREWATAHAWYEAKSFADGGKTLVFAATRDEAANVDIYFLDLERGGVRRVTSHPEWDETAECSPDGRWVAFESTRAHVVLRLLSLIGMPPLIDFAAVLPITNMTLTGPLFATHEPYLIDREGDRGSYHGQRLSTEGDSGWATRDGVRWHPDGTRLVWGAVLGPSIRDTHLGIATLTARQPAPPREPTGVPPVEWAPPLQDVGLRLNKIDRLLPGAIVGRARLRVDGSLLGGAFVVEFDHFSERPGEVLDGQLAISLVASDVATISADVRRTGISPGSLKAQLEIRGNQARGSIQVERARERYAVELP